MKEPYRPNLAQCDGRAHLFGATVVQPHLTRYVQVSMSNTPTALCDNEYQQNEGPGETVHARHLDVGPTYDRGRGGTAHRV